MRAGPWVCFLAAAGAGAHGGALRDVGIFSDLDEAVRVTLPRRTAPGAMRLRLDDERRAVVLYEEDFPLKIYRLAALPPSGALTAPAVASLLRPDDAAELGGLVSVRTVVERAGTARAAASPSDVDGDGIPDSLDILMGARKLVLNHARYTEGYYQIPYPNGDVPRDVGV